MAQQPGPAEQPQPEAAEVQDLVGLRRNMDRIREQVEQLQQQVGNGNGERDQNMDVTMRNLSSQLNSLHISLEQQERRQTQGQSRQGMPLRDFQLGDDIIDYLDHANNVKMCNLWTDERAKHGVNAALKGDAARIAQDIRADSRNNDNVAEPFERFCKRLRERFLPKAEASLAIAEFTHARQGPMELTHVWHARVRSLYFRAYLREHLDSSNYVFADHQDELLKTTFIEGLRNSALHEGVCRRDPATFQDALTAAMAEVAVMKRKRNGPRGQHYQAGGFRSQGNAGNGGGNGNRNFGQVDSMQNQGGPSNRSRNGAGGERKCYTCNSTQHLERNCPGRRKWFKVFNKGDDDYDQWLKKKRSNPSGARVAAVQEANEEADEEMVPEMGEDEFNGEPGLDMDPDFQ